MKKEFKEIIAPFLFEGKEYCPQFCSYIDGWPSITFKDEWHRPEKQKVSNENVRVFETGNHHIKVLAGNEVQGYCLITISHYEGKAYVEFAIKVDDPNDFPAIPEEKISNEFTDIKIKERVHKKSASVWQMELNLALQNENYEKASEIRDVMKKENISIGK